MTVKSQKKIFIHIGPHKTGTKTIQKGLWMNQDMLKENGYLIPMAGRPFPQSAGHHNLGWESRNHHRFNAKFGTWKDLQSEIGKCEASNVIISSEGFSRIDKSQIKQMIKILGSMQIIVVAYLRRQDKVIQSNWVQLIKNNWVCNPKSFENFIGNNEFNESYVDHFTLLKKWTECLGKESLVIRVMEKKSLRGHLFHDFLSTCDVSEAENYEIPHNRNESPGIKTLVAMYYVKDRLYGKIDARQMWEILNQINRFGEMRGWNVTRINLIDRPLFEKIILRFKKGNKKIAREFFDRDQLFLEPFIEKNMTPFNVDDLTSKEIADLITFIQPNFEELLPFLVDTE